MRELSSYSDNEIVEINNISYAYDAFYKRLENDTQNPAIVCPICYNTKFEISYSNYSCIANCKCGHKFEVYGG